MKLMVRSDGGTPVIVHLPDSVAGTSSIEKMANSILEKASQTYKKPLTWSTHFLVDDLSGRVISDVETLKKTVRLAVVPRSSPAVIPLERTLREMRQPPPPAALVMEQQQQLILQQHQERQRVVDRRKERHQQPPPQRVQPLPQQQGPLKPQATQAPTNPPSTPLPFPAPQLAALPAAGPPRTATLPVVAYPPQWSRLGTQSLRGHVAPNSHIPLPYSSTASLAARTPIPTAPPLRSAAPQIRNLPPPPPPLPTPTPPIPPPSSAAASQAPTQSQQNEARAQGNDRHREQAAARAEQQRKLDLPFELPLFMQRMRESVALKAAKIMRTAYTDAYGYKRQKAAGLALASMAVPKEAITAFMFRLRERRKEYLSSVSASSRQGRPSSDAPKRALTKQQEAELEHLRRKVEEQRQQLRQLQPAAAQERELSKSTGQQSHSNHFHTDLAAAAAAATTNTTTSSVPNPGTSISTKALPHYSAAQGHPTPQVASRRHAPPTGGSDASYSGSSAGAPRFGSGRGAPQRGVIAAQQLHGQQAAQQQPPPPSYHAHRQAAEQSLLPSKRPRAEGPLLSAVEYFHRIATAPRPHMEHDEERIESVRSHQPPCQPTSRAESGDPEGHQSSVVPPGPAAIAVGSMNENELLIEDPWGATSSCEGLKRPRDLSCSENEAPPLPHLLGVLSNPDAVDLVELSEVIAACTQLENYEIPSLLAVGNRDGGAQAGPSISCFGSQHEHPNFGFTAGDAGLNVNEECEGEGDEEEDEEGLVEEVDGDASEEEDYLRRLRAECEVNRHLLSEQGMREESASDVEPQEATTNAEGSSHRSSTSSARDDNGDDGDAPEVRQDSSEVAADDYERGSSAEFVADPCESQEGCNSVADAACAVVDPGDGEEASEPAIPKSSGTSDEDEGETCAGVEQSMKDM